MNNFNTIFKNSAELNFIRNSYEQTIRLIDILSQISKNKNLKNLALKGGGAVNLSFSSLPRCFFDLDFDIDDENFGLGQIEVIKKSVFSELNEICLSMGYQQSNKNRSSYSLDSFCYSYYNYSNNKNYIKLEVNYSLISHILPLERFSTKFEGIENFIFQRVHLLEILAIKISVLLYRGRVKDLFDVYQLLMHFSNIDFDLLRKSVIFYYVIGTNNPCIYSIDNIMQINEHDAKKGLYPLIKKKTIQGTKEINSLNLNEMKTTVLEFIRELLVLKNCEIKFLNQFYQGKYEIDLLFSDSEIVKRLEKHPMALWKAEHK